MINPINLMIILLLSFAPKAYTQNYNSGKVLESLSMPSEIMGKSVEYSVYLPPDYEESDRSYPILYLLHGYTDDETAWVQFGEVNYTADEGIRSG
jgi:enterochelin esterase-like enzyme